MISSRVIAYYDCIVVGSGIVRNITPEQATKIDMDPYVEDFTGDIMRLSQNKQDAQLMKTIVENSRGG